MTRPEPSSKEPPAGRRAGARSASRRKSQTTARQVANADLMEVLRRGAVVGRHQFAGVFGRLLWTAVLFGALQAVLYAGYVAIRSPRPDPLMVALVGATLFVLPIVTTGVLTALRRYSLSFAASALITLIIFNFGVVVLSAGRVSVSYTGLLLCLPLALLGMLIAAGQLRRGVLERVALLDFPGASKVISLFGEDSISLVTAPTADNLAFDRILIDGASHHSTTWSRYLTIASMRGVDVVPWETEYERRSGQVNIESFDFSHLVYSPEQIYYTRAKRVLDLILLVLVLPIAAPVGALVWLYIRAIDGGPSIFVQTRRGYGGKNFRMLKFRTMRSGTQGGAASQGDKRILPGCGFLRRYRIDEWPQLINIWRGEMSWIGPRPESIELAKRYEREIPEYAYRLLLLPGVSGWAQVRNGYTTNVSEARVKLAYDLYYLKKISFDLDIEITLRTIKTLFTRQGAR